MSGLAIRAVAIGFAILPGIINAADLSLPQHSGEALTLEQPAQRLITLAPHLAELVYLAGAGDRLLATVAHSNYPAAAEALPRIGDAFRFDLEQIMALQPDLVIAWDSGNPEAAITGLEELGLPVWRTEVRTIEDMATLMRQIGIATGQDAEPQALAVEQRWKALQDQFTGRQPVSYFYQVAERPLYTVNGEHLISRGLSACGAHNVFVDLPNLAPQINPEAVLAADPDVLLSGRLDTDDEPLAHWRSWPRLAAVQNEALFYLPADLINRATPRLLDAIEIACLLLDDYRFGIVHGYSAISGITTPGTAP